MGAIAIKAEQTVQEWGNGLAVRLTAPVARAPWVPERRDIIWIDFNPQVDREMKDMHPMLVLSPRHSMIVQAS